MKAVFLTSFLKYVLLFCLKSLLVICFFFPYYSVATSKRVCRASICYSWHSESVDAKEEQRVYFCHIVEDTMQNKVRKQLLKTTIWNCKQESSKGSKQRNPNGLVQNLDSIVASHINQVKRVCIICSWSTRISNLRTCKRGFASDHNS